MAWKTIVEANSLDEFQSAQPSVGDLPAGTPVKLTFEFPHWYPLAGIANIAEAEWVAQRFYDEAHIQVTDVNSPDAWHVVIEGKIVGTPTDYYHCSWGHCCSFRCLLGGSCQVRG